MTVESSSSFFSLDRNVCLAGSGIAFSAAWLSGILEGHIVMPHHYSWREKIRYGAYSLPYTVIGQNVPILQLTTTPDYYETVPNNNKKASKPDQSLNNNRRNLKLSPRNVDVKIKEKIKPRIPPEHPIRLIESQQQWKSRIQRIFRTGRAVCLSVSCLFYLSTFFPRDLTAPTSHKEADDDSTMLITTTTEPKRIPLFIHPDEIKKEKTKVRWKVLREQFKFPNSDIIPFTIHSSAPSDDSFHENNDLFIISIPIWKYIMHEIHKTIIFSMKQNNENSTEEPNIVTVLNSDSPTTTTTVAKNTSKESSSVKDDEEGTQNRIQLSKDGNNDVFVYGVFDNLGKIIRLTWANYIWQPPIHHLDGIGKTIRLTWKSYVWHPLNNKLMPLLSICRQQPNGYLVFLTHDKFDSFLPFCLHKDEKWNDIQVSFQKIDKNHQFGQTIETLIHASPKDNAKCCYVVWGCTDEETCLVTHQLVSTGKMVISILENQQIAAELNELCPTTGKIICIEELQQIAYKRVRDLVLETDKSWHEISKEMSTFHF